MKSILKFSTAGLNLDTVEPHNKRARLNTGFLCNYNCEFCYYKDRLTERDSLETIKARVDDIYNYGIREIDLSGGESSVEPNWFPILDYCREKGFYISTLSHGGKFCKMDFLQKSYDHGLREVLFSLHGSNAELHDKITDRKKSFERILQAIDNCQKLGMCVRINCTVYDLNHELLATEYSDLIQRIKPFQVNFIALNYDTDNADFRAIDYQSISKSIKKCIDNLTPHVKYINVRYIPFCYMQGYERHVVNYYQHVYDIYDWNLAIYNHNIDTSKEYTELEKLRHSHEAAKHFRMNAYYKDDGCKKCKYNFICDGVEKQLKDTPLHPVEGKPITEVNYYRRGFYEA
jgi:radical SAM protein with 4Fe4S-binding SPASM domain